MRPSKKQKKNAKAARPTTSEPVRGKSNLASRQEEIFLQMAENIREIFWMLDAATL